MRKITLLAFVALPAATAAADAPAARDGTAVVRPATPLEPEPECQRLPGADHAVTRPPAGGEGQARLRTGPKKLGELPRGEGYLAVWRDFDGCFQPAMFRRQPG